MNTQKPDAVELLPCPFCGGSPSLYNDPDNDSDGEDDRYYIACHNGCASGIHSSNRRMISERWNARDTAERDALKAEVAAMEHANRWTYLPELPKQSGFYIVTVTDELNCDGETVEQMWFHDSLDDWEINQDVRRVIAWRPLPEPATIRERK